MGWLTKACERGMGSPPCSVLSAGPALPTRLPVTLGRRLSSDVAPGGAERCDWGRDQTAGRPGLGQDGQQVLLTAREEWVWESP